MQKYVSWTLEIMLVTSTCLASSLPVVNSFVARDSLGKNDQVLYL